MIIQKSIVLGFISLMLSGGGRTSYLPKETKSDSTEIQIGGRLIKTNKYTPKGTPVIPMWKAAIPTTDQRTGAGFPILSAAEHAVVWQPPTREDGAYNHYACLIHYKGKFFAMWGNHPLGEDGPGQRVLFSYSEVWGNWTDARELFSAPGLVKPRTEKGIHLKPDRWVIVNDALYAVTYVHGAGRYPIARQVTEDGAFGEPFLITQLPDNAELPVYMKNIKPNILSPVANEIREWYVKNNQVSWWAASAEGVMRKAIDGAQLIETFAYKAKDGGQVLMLRNWGTPSNPVHNNRMYVSFRRGNGKWGIPYPTDIPDSPSRAQALTLDNGTVLLIGNQVAPIFDEALYLDRDPMTVSVSKDGYTFDKVYALRTNSSKKFRISGVGGRNPGYAYSSSIVHKDWLYTFYSIGKEDMAITRVSLSSIRLK